MFLVSVSYQHQRQHQQDPHCKQEQHHCTHTPTPKKKRKRKRKERSEREKRRREENERRTERRKRKRKRKEKVEREKQITVTAGPFWWIISNYNRRASAGESCISLQSDPLQELERLLFVARMVLFTYLCECSVKTELNYRSNCAKNSLNRFQIGTMVYQRFSMAFDFESTSGQWTLEHGKLDVRFLRMPTSSFPAYCPNSPCGPSSLIQYHFFSEPSPLNDHCLVPNLLA